MPTLKAINSGTKRGTEKLKYVLETRDNCLSLLFSVLITQTSPSGSKIELKIRTFDDLTMKLIHHLT